MTEYFLPPHRSQFDGSPLANQNCTPASGADGLAATTQGRISLSGGQLRSYLPRSDETNPETPGWSLQDLAEAIRRLPATWKVPVFTPHSGPWPEVMAALSAGFFIVLPGDSEEFADGTCSGAYNGDHAVGLHPLMAANPYIELGDPICNSWRRESAAVLQRYAENLSGPRVRYGTFASPVPKTAPALYTLHIVEGTREILTANFSGSCISSWTKRPWGGKASAAPCLATEYRKGCHSGGASIARVTAGAFAGQYVRIQLATGTYTTGG